MTQLKKIGLIFVSALMLTACRSQTVSTQPPVQVSPIPTPPAQNAILNKLLTGVTIKVPESKFTVKLNSANHTAEFGDNIKNPYAGFGSVTIGQQAVELHNVIFSTIAVNNGGSGEFFYLAAFEESKDGWLMTATTPLADRIQFQSLTTTNDQIVVSYLDHSPTQAMVEMPNVHVQKTFKYANRKLILSVN